MKKGYFESVGDKCYDAKHISDSFTNIEQINLCKQEQHDETFGQFDKMVKAYRDSD